MENFKEKTKLWENQELNKYLNTFDEDYKEYYEDSNWWNILEERQNRIENGVK